VGELKWIKIVTDLFDDPKIKLIESEQKADTFLIIWVKILCLAGKLNNSGLLALHEPMKPYTIEMLSGEFSRKLKVVEQAVSIFLEYGMLEKINETYVISNWSKHQSADKIEKKNEYMRDYMTAYRSKQKELTKGLCKSNCKTNSRLNVSRTELDKEYKEEIKNIEKEKDIKASEDAMSVPTDAPNGKTDKIDYDSICDFWNTHSLLKEITKITEQRKPNVNARIREHGIEAIYKMIDQAGQSPFLRGDNRQGFVATFDWCFKPKNFVKVLEGNYIDSKTNKTIYDDVEERVRKMNEYMGVKS